MSNIDTINVGGLDYDIEDATARDIATGAVTVSAYVENGNTASRAYPTVGTPVNWKGSLYYTTATIASGATLSTSNLTAAANLGAMLRNIKTYVGSDSKLHFTDATGADTALNFSNTTNIYNALVAKGVRPSANTEAAIITAIQNMTLDVKHTVRVDFQRNTTTPNHDVVLCRFYVDGRITASPEKYTTEVENTWAIFVSTSV